MFSFSVLASKVKLHAFFDLSLEAVFDIVFKAIADGVIYLFFLHIILIPPLSGMKVPPLVTVLAGQNILFKAPRLTVIVHETELVIMGDKPV
jgi:hypothetical protein